MPLVISGIMPRGDVKSDVRGDVGSVYRAGLGVVPELGPALGRGVAPEMGVFRVGSQDGFFSLKSLLWFMIVRVKVSCHIKFLHL